MHQWIESKSDQTIKNIIVQNLNNIKLDQHAWTNYAKIYAANILNGNDTEFQRERKMFKKSFETRAKFAKDFEMGLKKAEHDSNALPHSHIFFNILLVYGRQYEVHVQ